MSGIWGGGRAFRYGDDVNTDVIFPGKYTYTLRTDEEIRSVALEDLDPTFRDRVQPGDVIVGGRNWGCGSSREQAVTCLLLSGVEVVIAASFSRIFYRNAINNGLLAIACSAAAESIEEGERVSVRLDRSTIEVGESRHFRFAPFDARVLELIRHGGLVEATRRRLAGAAP
ncbi:MAG: 3-isopropylmalate dehydratase [Acidobacteriota bacterium]